MISQFLGQWANWQNENLLDQKSGSLSSSFCFATSSHAVAWEKRSASSDHKENEGAVLEYLQRPFQLSSSVIPFFYIWRGTHFASEDHYVWRELLFHDPGLEFILLTDFEMLQLDLCSFFPGLRLSMKSNCLQGLEHNLFNMSGKALESSILHKVPPWTGSHNGPTEEK